MAFTNIYAFNIAKDASLAAEKQWRVGVFRLPSTPASGATATVVTTGPLGSSGTANANYVHGDGTTTGFADPAEAVQKALVFLLNDRALNGDS